MDDATGTIYSAFLIDEEGTASTFWALNEVFGRRGLPMSLYTTDRGAHYFHTPEKWDEVDRGHLTQVGRALKQLGVEQIGAYSPPIRRIARRETGVSRRPRRAAAPSGRSGRSRTGCRTS